MSDMVRPGTRYRGFLYPCSRCGGTFVWGSYAEHARTVEHRAHLNQQALKNRPLPRLRGNPNAERNRQIADLLHDHPELTLQDLGDLLGITRERVRQIAKGYGGVRREQLGEITGQGLYRDGRPRDVPLYCRRCENFYPRGTGVEHRASEIHRLGKLTNPLPTSKAERNQRWVELYLTGMTSTEIIAALKEEGWPSEGLFPEAVYRMLPRYGIKPIHGVGHYEHKGRRPRSYDQAVIDHYRAGMPLAEIHQTYWPQVSTWAAHSRLYSVLNAYHIPRRRPDITRYLKARWKREKAQKSPESPEMPQNALKRP